MTSEIVGEGLLRQFAQWSDDTLWLSLWTAVSFLGSGRFFTLLLPVVFALEKPGRALRFASTVLGGAFVAEALKAAFGRPRLDVSSLGVFTALEDPGVFDNEAFPSGHALMAVLIWGDLLLRGRPRPVRLAGIILVLAIGFSRLALLRHDLLDVLGGYAVGVLLLMLLWRSEAALRALARRPWPLLAALWLVGCAAALALLPRPSLAITLGVWAGVGAAAAWSAAHEWPARSQEWRVAAAVLAMAVAIGWTPVVAPWTESRLPASALAYALLGALIAGPIARLRPPGR